MNLVLTYLLILQTWHLLSVLGPIWQLRYRNCCLQKLKFRFQNVSFWISNIFKNNVPVWQVSTWQPNFLLTFPVLALWNDGLLIDVIPENLSLVVDANNTISCLVLHCHKDGLARDTIHIDASTRLKVVEMYKTIFCYEINDTMFLGYLHGNWEVVCDFRQEADINGFLGSGVVLYNMSMHTPYGHGSTAYLQKLWWKTRMAQLTSWALICHSDFNWEHTHLQLKEIGVHNHSGQVPKELV